METYNYQAPRQPMFNGTVFITVLAALLFFAALCFGGFMLFQKMKQNEANSPALSNEEAEALKAENAKNVLSSGLSRAKKVAEPIIEETQEVVTEVKEEIKDVNDIFSDFIKEKHPQLLVEQPSAEVVE